MKIKQLLLVSMALALVAGCQEKIEIYDNWPTWPSRPIIEDALMKGASGESAIQAGDKVKFSAHVFDDYTPLESYTLQVMSGDVVLASSTGKLSGNSADIACEMEMPFGANYAPGVFYPLVVLEVANSTGGKTSSRLSDDVNVSVSRPETPKKLYIVDNNSKVFEMDRIGSTYQFKTNAETLSGIGSSFRIAEKVSSSGSIDYSGLVWGQVDGNLIVVSSAGDNAIPVPDGSYSCALFSGTADLKTLRFDTYSFEMSKLLDYTTTLDKSDFEDASYGGKPFLFKVQDIPQDSEVIITGLGDDLSIVLPPYLFADIEGNSARFIGVSERYKLFFDKTAGYMYVNVRNGMPDNLWVTGVGAGFPLEPYQSTFNWFGNEPFGYFSFHKIDAVNFEIMLYLGADFCLQTYRLISWGTVLKWTSATPSLMKVKSNNDAVAGPDFKPGVYWLRVNVETGEASLEKA
ncbi:MAG: hypothetical protein J6N80_07190 [Bacteroidales bacterium]|nr:hypothetical protein [Bacteroidales bacterium]